MLKLMLERPLLNAKNAYAAYKKSFQSNPKTASELPLPGADVPHEVV